MAADLVVDLQEVNKTFNGPAGPIQALKSVSLRVYPGEFVGVRGPSGSGKSTLINMITGIYRPTPIGAAGMWASSSSSSNCFPR
jgi:ABC-type multidrug transport system ATPase subunit